MGESACETVVWLATYSTLNVHKGQRVKIAHEALSPFVKRCLPTKYVVEEPSSIGYVVGLVRVQVASRVHRLLRLTASEQEQLNLYQDIFSRNMLGGDAFIVRVLSAATVEPPVRLQHCGTNRLKGFLINLEHGQPETLLRDMVANRMLPAWMPDAPPGGAIRVPDPYAVLASSGVWNSLILPSFHNSRSSRGEVHALQWAKIGIQPREVPALFARCELMSDECVPLTAEVATQAADFLREQATSMDDSTEFFTETFMAIAQCISALDTFADELRPVSFVKAVSKSCLQRNYRTEYKVAYLIHAFLHADILRDSSGLQAAVRLAFLQHLPGHLRGTVVESLDKAMEQSSVVVSKAQLSRWRCLVDVAEMLCMRHENDKARLEGGMVRALMADASTQHGREFQHVVVQQVPRSRLIEVFRASKATVCMWENCESPEHEDARFEAELPLRAVLQEFVHLVFLPIVVLASGRASLRNKFHAVLHAIFLIASGSTHGLTDYMDSITSHTSDLGTEVLLSKVPALPLRQWLPWLPLGPQFGQTVDKDGGLAKQQFHENNYFHEDDDSLVSISNALCVAGILHITHNAGNSVLAACPVLNNCVNNFAPVCDLLREEHSCFRLRESCFVSPCAKTFHKDLRKFNGKIYRERWGTIAYAISQLLPLRGPLTLFWDKERYMQKTGERGHHASPVTVNIIDAALKDPMFWASLLILEAVLGIIRDIIEWGEGCPCHSHMDWEGIPNKVAQRWMACKHRGRRLAEIASGEFF